MFKKIREFIKAFKDAYNTINLNKINAKKAIDDYKKEVDNIVYAADSLKIIFIRLESIYKYFPIKERQDFITKTLDLLSYGRKDANGYLKDVCSWSTLYCSEAVGAKNNLAYLKRLYKKGCYNSVKELTKEYSKRLEEFYILYGIKENPSEANE